MIICLQKRQETSQKDAFQRYFIISLAGGQSHRLNLCPPPETTSWHYRPGEEVDLGSAGVGIIRIPPAFERRYLGGTITVDENGVGWSGDEIDVDDEGIISRSERQGDIEAMPDEDTRNLLRRLLKRRN